MFIGAQQRIFYDRGGASEVVINLFRGQHFSAGNQSRVRATGFEGYGYDRKDNETFIPKIVYPSKNVTVYTGRSASPLPQVFQWRLVNLTFEQVTAFRAIYRRWTEARQPFLLWDAVIPIEETHPRTRAMVGPILQNNVNGIDEFYAQFLVDFTDFNYSLLKGSPDRTTDAFVASITGVEHFSELNNALTDDNFS